MYVKEMVSSVMEGFATACCACVLMKQRGRAMLGRVLLPEWCTCVLGGS